MVEQADRRQTTSRSGLLTALDVCVAPTSAFERLREAPTWGWAFVIAAVVGMVASFAMSPVMTHAIGLDLAGRLAASPQLASIPAAQRGDIIRRQIELAQTVGRFGFIAVPIFLGLGSLIQAVIMLVANAIAHGDGSFKRYWALAVNSAIVGTALASASLAIIVLVRGNDGFGSAAEVGAALPGLALLVPASAKAAAAFLSVFNVFALWNMALLAVGMTIVGRVPRVPAIVTALIILVGYGLLPLAGALAQR